jgi:hypothetical protein
MTPSAPLSRAERFGSGRLTLVVGPSRQQTVKSRDLSLVRREAKDRFSYIFVFCPNFPPLTGATTATAFEKLIGLLDVLIQNAKGDDAKQWLRVCLQEIRESRKHYDDGKQSEGRKLIMRAETHFQNAFSKIPIAPRFVAGDPGAAVDLEKGSPT